MPHCAPRLTRGGHGVYSVCCPEKTDTPVCDDAPIDWNKRQQSAAAGSLQPIGWIQTQVRGHEKWWWLDGQQRGGFPSSLSETFVLPWNRAFSAQHPVSDEWHFHSFLFFFFYIHVFCNLVFLADRSFLLKIASCFDFAGLLMDDQVRLPWKCTLLFSPRESGSNTGLTVANIWEKILHM